AISVLHDEQGNVRAQEGFITGNGADRPQQLIARRRFQHIASGSALERLPHQPCIGIHGNEQDVDRQLQSTDLLRRLNAVQTRHHNVQNQHIRLELCDKFNRLLSVGSLADHIDIRSAFEQCAQSCAHHGMVFSDQHTDHGTSSGRNAEMIVPFTADELTRNSPPTNAIRSCRLKSPIPSFAEASAVEKPLPLSWTVRIMARSSTVNSTQTRLACECLTTLVSVS